MVLAAGAARALTFDVPASGTKCISEVIAANDLVRGRVSVVPDSGSSNSPDEKSGIEFKITSPNKDTEFQQRDIPVAGVAVSFVSATAGAHRMCAQNMHALSRRVNVDIVYGASAKDYAELAAKEKLQPLELELRQLEDRIEAIHSAMMQTRASEEQHRNTNENTNARVQWFSIATIVIVVLIAVVQVWHLHSFFRSKKYF